ncbi:hypothetical protein CFE14_RS15865 [Vibrio parahaemolyticus]|nr:hypothetical protein [Vibrio parahaemolyticus]
MKLRNVAHNGASYQGYTEDELQGLGVPELVVNQAKTEQVLADIQLNRKQAYAEESDPLFLEWQYDQTPEKEQAWRDKVAEIKARYPLPSEV